MTREPRSAPRRWTLGLRARVTLALALSAFAVSLLGAVVVWTTSTRLLLEQRERTLLRQALNNAAQIQSAAETPGAEIPQLLAGLPRSTGSDSLLRLDDQWYATSLQRDQDDVPAALRDVVVDGGMARQRVVVDGAISLIVGVPVGRDNAYFEVFPLNQLDETFRVLSTTLVATTLAAPVLGLVLGNWAARRALGPLNRVTAAAGAIAAGDWSARISDDGDPDLRELARSFNKTAAALQRRVETDIRFAATVSHELRTPLTTMVAAVEVMKDRYQELSPGGREGLGLLETEVLRFERLVDDLLEISRDDGHTHLVLEEARLAELVTQSLDPVARNRLVVSGRATDVVVCVDKRRMERVISNLVTNARTHGGGLARIVVEQCGQQARVAVEDHGPGVPVDQRERIFERFTRISKPTDVRGVGLGLALVAQHVRAHDGRVWVEDAADGGARFVIELPVVTS